MSEFELSEIHPEYWRSQANVDPEVHAAFILAYESKITVLIDQNVKDQTERERWFGELRVDNPTLVRYEWVARELGLTDQSGVVKEAIQIYLDGKRN